MAKRGATPITETQLIAQVAANLGGGFSQSDVRNVVKALKQEIVTSVRDGKKVTLTGVVSFTPSAKEGRKRGTVVRNPFDQTERTLKTDEPDKFKVKALASSAIAKEFPSVRSQKGQALLAQLKPKTKGRK